MTLLASYGCQPVAAERGGVLQEIDQPHQAIVRAVLSGEQGHFEGVITKSPFANKAAKESDEHDKEIADQIKALKRIANDRGLSAESATISVSGMYSRARPWSWVPVSEGRVRYKFGPWLSRVTIVGNEGKSLSLVYGLGYSKDSFWLATSLAEDVLSDQDWAMITLWYSTLGENFDHDITAVKTIERMSLNLAKIVLPSLREVAKGKFELRPVSSTARLIVHELTDGTGIRAEVVPVSPP